MERPILYVLAGVNGAGKSSVGGHILTQAGMAWFNPDTFARELVQRLGRSQEQANAEAKSIAREIAGDIGELASAARTMSGVIGRGHEGKSFDRQGITNILRANLEQNPFAFGSWMAEAPGAIDGRKDDVKGKADLGANEAQTGPPFDGVPHEADT